MSLIPPLVIAIIALIATFFLTTLTTTFRCVQRRKAKKQIRALGNYFLYRRLQHTFFPKKDFEVLVFATDYAQNITRFVLGGSIMTLLLAGHLFPFEAPFQLDTSFPSLFWVWNAFVAIVLVGTIIFIGDFLPRYWGTYRPEAALRLAAPISSLLLLILFPLIYPFLRLSPYVTHVTHPDYTGEPMDRVREQIIDIIQDADVDAVLDPLDRKLIESVVTFKERVAREVMVPRVDVFSLPSSISIKEACKLLEREGYSRTPVYRNNVDNIMGVLMYKDILSKYMEYEEKGNDITVLNAPIETIAKSVMYTPESKKIAALLQEFRKKQVHLAIVVDEYGGTEGIVTIEDILEQIVGDIADEYDDEETLFQVLPGGSWLVDARMSISDVEEEIGIKIPQDGEYDTIGGYIFNLTGTIPAKGFVIQHDDFEIKIVSSSDRCVEKVRIGPPLKSNSPHDNEESKP